MKSKLIVILFTIILSVWTNIGIAQTTMPKGKAQLIEFTNETAKFTVPAGKTWYIINAFFDYKVDLKYNTSGEKISKDEDTQVFIKSINGKILTDLSINKLGPMFSGSLVLPENTIIEFIITSGSWIWGPIKQYNLNAYLNLIEVDN